MILIVRYKLRKFVCFTNTTRFTKKCIMSLEKKNCESWCVDYAGGEPTNFGALPDGSPCSYQRPFDLCFQVMTQNLVFNTFLYFYNLLYKYRCSIFR